MTNTSKLADMNQPRFLRDGSMTGFSPLSSNPCPTKAPSCAGCGLAGRDKNPKSPNRGKVVDCRGRVL